MKTKIRHNSTLLIIGLLAITFSSCGLFKKKCKHTDVLMNVPDNVATRIGKNSFDFTDLSIRARATYNGDGQKQNFSMAIKMKKDSVVWISMSAFGFEAARALITKDSLKVINKLGKSYFVTSIDNVKNIVGMNLSLDQLQSVLVGNTLFSADRYRSMSEGNKVTTFEARLQNILELSQSYRILQSNLAMKNSPDSISFTYSGFQKIKKIGCIPSRIFANYPNGNTSLSIQYSTISTDPIGQLPFSIPKSYKRAN